MGEGWRGLGPPCLPFGLGPALGRSERPWEAAAGLRALACPVLRPALRPALCCYGFVRGWQNCEHCTLCGREKRVVNEKTGRL